MTVERKECIRYNIAKPLSKFYNDKQKKNSKRLGCKAIIRKSYNIKYLENKHV